MKVSIFGTGAYGIALALMFNENNCDITMWSRFEEEVERLRTERVNEKVLPGVHIPENIKFTSNEEEAMKDAELIVIAIPAKFVNGVFESLKPYYKDQHICVATKGIEQDSCLFVDDVLSKHIKTDKVAVISGPSFAVDIAKNVPIGLSLGTKNEETARIIKEALENETLKLRTTDDIIGIEICGSIKNVMAIAAGMLDGMGMTESTQAMFITESLHDIKELITCMGGDGKTVLSFAGFGDLLLTCTSTKSRNFKFGQLLGSKAPQEEIDEYVKNTTIEGLYTLESIEKLVNNNDFDIPIIDLIYDIVFHSRDAEDLKTFLIQKK